VFGRDTRYSSFCVFVLVCVCVVVGVSSVCAVILCTLQHQLWRCRCMQTCERRAREVRRMDRGAAYSTLRRKLQPSVRRALPPVGWQSTVEHAPQNTTVDAWENTVVLRYRNSEEGQRHMPHRSHSSAAAENSAKPSSSEDAAAKQQHRREAARAGEREWMEHVKHRAKHSTSQPLLHCKLRIAVIWCCD